MSVSSSPSRFAGPTILGTGAATLFTSSGDSLVEMVHVSNPTGSPVDLTMSLGADAAGTRFIDGLPIAADSERKFRFYLPLADGEILQAFAGTGSVLVATIDGRQLTAVESFILQEDGSGHILQEDGSGGILQEA
ncbi:MAG: hypothetical protein OEW06_18130 [Gemmatimonadota bacterium]|nr:hypothetical protein [Gemmatimonadota bacterium]